MRHMLWLLLVGLLATTALAQNSEDAIAQLAEDSALEQINDPEPAAEHEGASHKTIAEILEGVNGVVQSFSSIGQVQPEADPAAESESVANDPPTDSLAEEVKADMPESKPTEEEPVAQEETAPEEVQVEASEAAEPTDTPAEEENAETAPDNQETTLSKKEVKAVQKYNEVVDKVLPILAKRLQKVGFIPISLDEETLVALDKEAEPEPEPEVVDEVKGTRKNKPNKNKKNKKNKRRGNNNRNRKGSEVVEEEDSRKNTRKGNNSNENKNSNEKNNKNKSTEKGGNRNSGEKKKKNKNRRKNKNKNKKNRNGQVNRRPKAMGDGEEDYIEEGRRKGGNSNNKKNRKQNKAGKRNKNKSRRRNNNKNKGRSEVEGREELEPALPTTEERSASNGRLNGLAKLTRVGDISTDISGKKHTIEAMVNVGPLSVNLKDKNRALTRAEVTTNLQAVMNFKVKAVSRRSKINLVNVEVKELTPEKVEVTRADLELAPEVVTGAQEQVVGAVDTARIGRILTEELNNIFQEDNIVENLETHPFLDN